MRARRDHEGRARFEFIAEGWTRLQPIRTAAQVELKQRGSRNRRRARERLAQLQRRIGNVRCDFLHRHSSRLAKTHRHLVLESLCTIGLMKTRLARSIADSA
jgi:putative transposase